MATKKNKNGNKMGMHSKNAGRKKCFKCGKFIPAEDMKDHMEISHPKALHYVPPADDDILTPVEPSEAYLRRELDDANEKYSHMNREYSQEVRKAEAYRSGLFELAHVLASILDLERER